MVLFCLLILVDCKEKFKYKVVKPKKKCVITYESTFSVTGFLTFAVVSATAVANVIANINNNNDLNNNNNNQDNVNNNNQMSNSADAENMGNARHLFQYMVEEELLEEGPLPKLMTAIAGFMMADHSQQLTHEKVVQMLC